MVDVAVKGAVSGEAEGSEGWVRQTLQQLVEDVEVPLSWLLFHHTRLLQQVVENMATRWVTFEIKVDVHVLSKAARVIVACCLGVSKCLHDVIGSDEQVCSPVGGVNSDKPTDC